MTNTLNLRTATLADAKILLAWRNDPQTRAASHNTDEILLENHLAWLESSLKKPEQRRLWVAELDGNLVGTCRADKEDNGWELSWTVAPEARGQGVAHKMLSKLIDTFQQPLTAQVKKDNMASMKVAERLGFVIEKEESGVLFYRR
ncbi:GNAT family N-acetyltransferase [Marinomonas sp. 5E14-1]|uniref:GNAT family N-acetyltransferase n=1 Tax=Marinomonas sp. 5E14-1 TaxID=3153922 RepID=UPI003266515E